MNWGVGSDLRFENPLNRIRGHRVAGVHPATVGETSRQSVAGFHIHTPRVNMESPINL